MPYDALLFLLSCIAVPIFFVAIMHSGELNPGEDAVEPLALLAAPVLANVAYTLGWFTEIIVDLVLPRALDALDRSFFEPDWSSRRSSRSFRRSFGPPALSSVERPA